MEYYKLYDGIYVDEMKKLKGSIVIDDNKVLVPMSSLGEFPALIISRDDFQQQGYDVSTVSDATMEDVASKIGDAICGDSYWDLIDDFGSRII